MENDDDNSVEIRFRVPAHVHDKWKAACYLRGLGMKAFVVSTVNMHLAGSGELQQSAPQSGTKVTKPAAPAPAVDRMVGKRLMWERKFKSYTVEQHEARIEEIREMFSRHMVSDDAWDSTIAEAEWHRARSLELQAQQAEDDE